MKNLTRVIFALFAATLFAAPATPINNPTISGAMNGTPSGGVFDFTNMTVLGIGSATSPFGVQTIAALKALNTSAVGNMGTRYVANYATQGDGGGGVFQYVAASSATTNIGTVFAPDSGGGRWLRLFSGSINVRWFGAKGDDSNDDGAAITAAYSATAGTVGNGELLFPNGIYRFSSGLTFDKWVTVTGLVRRDDTLDPIHSDSNGRGAVLRPTSAIASVAITINAGALKELTVDGSLTTDKTGVLVGSSISGGVILDTMRIARFGGTTSRGLKVRQTVGCSFTGVNIQYCAVNLEVSDEAGDGTPTTSWFRNCYFSYATTGAGVLFKGGRSQIFETCVFESNKQQGFYVSVGVTGDSFGNVLRDCWFEDNWTGNLSLTNYSFEQYSPGAGAGFSMDGVRFQGGSSARARPMRLWQTRSCELKRIYIPTPLTPNMIRIEEVNSEVRFDGPLYSLDGFVIPYGDAVVNVDSSPDISYNPLLAQNNLSDLADLATAKATLGITTGQFLAIDTDDDADAGRVGEVMVSDVFPPSSGVGLTSVTAANVTSITLTSGDWDVWGVALFNFGAGATCSQIRATVSTASGVIDGPPYYGQATQLSTIATSADSSLPTARIRVTVANGGTEQVYLVALAGFAVSTCKAYGHLEARRMR